MLPQDQNIELQLLDPLPSNTSTTSSSDLPHQATTNTTPPPSETLEGSDVGLLKHPRTAESTGIQVISSRRDWTLQPQAAEAEVCAWTHRLGGWEVEEVSGRRSFHIDEVDIGTASIVQEGDELEETSSRLERDTSVSQVVGIVGIDADDARLSGGFNDVAPGNPLDHDDVALERGTGHSTRPIPHLDTRAPLRPREVRQVVQLVTLTGLTTIFTGVSAPVWSQADMRLGTLTLGLGTLAVVALTAAAMTKANRRRHHTVAAVSVWIFLASLEGLVVLLTVRPQRLSPPEMSSDTHS